MNSDDLVFFSAEGDPYGLGGKRTFEPDGRRRLIETCLQPGVSISGMPPKARINANQSRKWILQSCEQT